MCCNQQAMKTDNFDLKPV